MAEFTLSIKTESTSELADIVAKLNGGQVKENIQRVVGEVVNQTVVQDVTAPVPQPVPGPNVTVTGDVDVEVETVNDAPPATDKNGLPWDERIHAGTKALNGDGTWKKRRGVDDATVAAVTAELTGAAPATTPAPQPEPTPAPAPTPAAQPETAPTPTPVPSTNRIQDFQQIVQELQKAGSVAAPNDYMSMYHGKIVQTLLKLSDVTTVPEATTEQMQKMYEVRDQIIANLPSIVAGVPIADLVK